MAREARGTTGKHVLVCYAKLSQQPPQHANHRQRQLDKIWSVRHTYHRVHDTEDEVGPHRLCCHVDSRGCHVSTGVSHGVCSESAQDYRLNFYWKNGIRISVYVKINYMKLNIQRRRGHIICKHPRSYWFQCVHNTLGTCTDEHK